MHPITPLGARAILLFVLAVLVSAAPSARSQVSVDFQDETGDMPGFDSTWIDGFGQGNTIYGLGANREIRAGRQGTLDTSVARGLVRWDVSRLKGAYTQVVGLRVELTVAKVSDATGNDLQVYLVGQEDAGWSAAESTKNRKLATAGYGWRSAVGARGFADIGVGAARASVSYGPSTAAGTKLSIELTGGPEELTEIIDAWIASRWSGLLLKAGDEGRNSSSIRFHSNRATSASNRPKLTVTYLPGRRVMSLAQAESMLGRYFETKGLSYSEQTRLVTRDGQEDIRFSLLYARLLLETGLAENVQRAEQIIAAVTAQQLNTPGVNASHGYILRNPGQAAGTYHGAPHDFTLGYGIEIRLRHADQLTAATLTQLDAFNQRAATWTQNNRVNNTRYITNQRTGVWYALRIAGQLYNNAWWRSAADTLMADAQDGLDALLAMGGVHEFNSPTYTPLTTHHLELLARDVSDAALRQKCRRLFQVVWTDIAKAFHQPSGQWGGAWSRAYGSTQYLPGSFSDTYLGQPEEEVCLVTETRAPAEVLSYFNDPLPGPRTIQREYISGPAVETDGDVVSHHVGSFGVVPIIGTQHQAEAYSLGTLNLARAGHPGAGERRPLVAVWGGSSPSASSFVLRVMTDSGSGLDDFGRPLVLARQSGGTALIGVTFSTNKADDPRYLEPVFTTSDLRIRFSSQGAAAAIPFNPPNVLNGFATKTVTTASGGSFSLWLRCVTAEFTDCQPFWEQNGGDLDLVVYRGAPRQFDLAKLARLSAGFVLRIDDAGAGAPLVSATRFADRTTLLAEGLSLDYQTRPDTYHVLARAYRGLLAAPPLPLFTDDFEAGLGQWTAEQGLIGTNFLLVQDGGSQRLKLVQNPALGHPALRFTAGSATWSDVVIETTIKVTRSSNNAPNVFARYQGLQNWYSFGYNFGLGGKWLIGRRDGSAMSNLFVSAAYPSILGREVRVRCVAKGSKLELWTLESSGWVKQCEGTDTRYPIGKIGVSTYDTDAIYDDFVVEVAP